MNILKPRLANLLDARSDVPLSAGPSVTRSHLPARAATGSCKACWQRWFASGNPPACEK